MTGPDDIPRGLTGDTVDEDGNVLEPVVWPGFDDEDEGIVPSG